MGVTVGDPVRQAYAALAEARIAMLQAVAAHDAREKPRRARTLAEVEVKSVEVVEAEQRVWVLEQDFLQEMRGVPAC